MTDAETGELWGWFWRERGGVLSSRPMERSNDAAAERERAVGFAFFESG